MPTSNFQKLFRQLLPLALTVVGCLLAPVAIHAQTYQTIQNDQSRMCLDDTNYSLSVGTVMQQYPCIPGGQNQNWLLTPLSNGYYTISNQMSKMCLDDTAGSKSSGTTIQQYTCIGGDINQMWKIVSLGNGYDNIVNVLSGLCLDVPGGSTTPGAQIQQNTCGSGVLHQMWQVVPAQGAFTGTQGSQKITNQLSGLCLGDPGGSKSNGTQVQQANCNAADQTQNWVFTPQGGGYYSISNQASGLCIDDTAGSHSAGTLMQLYSCISGDPNQNWWLVPTGNGNYNLVNQSSDICLDDTGGSKSPGTAMQQYTCLSNLNQSWQITPTAVQITQWGYDNNHTTANLKETILNTVNVNPATFGKIGSYSVKGPVFAQPLYMQGVTVPGIGVKNVLYVATMNDWLYAFDADHPGTTPLWSRDYTNGGALTPPGGDGANGTIGPYEGIWGTPVIDPALGEMFFVVGTVESGAPIFRLHAVNIASGAEIGTPQMISGSYSSGAYSISFTDPTIKRGNRPGLALSNGEIFVAFGANNSGDDGPYSGWVFTFNESNLAQVGIFATSTTGNRDGIWASGASPSVDPNGRVYFTTGNGGSTSSVAAGAYDGVNNFNESVLQFTPSTTAGPMKPTDWYTPSNVTYLDNLDLDVGCSATSIIPGTNILLAGGKTSEVYAIKMSNMGKFQAEASPNPPWATTDPQLSQTFHVGTGTVVNFSDSDRIVQFPIWPNSPTGSTLVYAWPALDYLYVYQANANGILNTTPASTGTLLGPGLQGVQQALSANASNPGTGILWASRQNSPCVGCSGTLYAFNAQNVSQILWSSTLNAARDSMAAPGKWVIPVVANGRVYFAGDNGEVDVYGLLH